MVGAGALSAAMSSAASLSGASLSGASLSAASLSGALSGAVPPASLPASSRGAPQSPPMGKDDAISCAGALLFDEITASPISALMPTSVPNCQVTLSVAASAPWAPVAPRPSVMPHSIPARRLIPARRRCHPLSAGRSSGSGLGIPVGGTLKTVFRLKARASLKTVRCADARAWRLASARGSRTKRVMPRQLAKVKGQVT